MARKTECKLAILAECSICRRKRQIQVRGGVKELQGLKVEAALWMREHKCEAG